MNRMATRAVSDPAPSPAQPGEAKGASLSLPFWKRFIPVRLDFRGRVIIGALFGALVGPILLVDALALPGIASFPSAVTVGLLAGAATGAVCGAVSAAFRGRRLAAGLGLGAGGVTQVLDIGSRSAEDRRTPRSLPLFALPGLVALVAILLGAWLQRRAGPEEKRGCLVALLHYLPRIAGLYGLVFLPAVLGGELALLLGWGSIGRTVAELCGGVVGCLFGAALVIPQQEKGKAPALLDVALVAPQRRDLFVLPVVLAGMIVTPFWLAWLDGTPGVTVSGPGPGFRKSVVSGPLSGQLQARTVTSCEAFAPDERTVVTGGTDSVIRLWDVESGKEKLALEGHRAAVRAVAFATTDRQQILSASDDGTMRLWDVASGLEVRRIRGYRSRVLAVAVSPDGRRALSGHTDGSVRLWDLDDMEEIRRLERHRAQVTCVAFAADGRTAFSGSLDKTVRRWDTMTGRQLGYCRGKKEILSLAVSRDGLTILASGADGVVQRWRWPPATGAGE
jgi:hypothetical protein